MAPARARRMGRMLAGAPDAARPPRGRPSLPAVTVLLVALGGAAGTLARYGLGRLVDVGALPWLTIGINVAGSLLLGFLIAVGHWFSAEIRTALAIGVLGGFTTFSTFSADVFLDIDAGRGAEAAAYLAASMIGGVGAAAVGYFLGRAVAH